MTPPAPASDPNSSVATLRAAALDTLLGDARWAPCYGWHDDHRAAVGTPAYLPAMMQVRAEFLALIAVLDEANLLGGHCLQLGLGECDASHAVWRSLFKHVVTIDHRAILRDDHRFSGGNTHDLLIQHIASESDPFDFIFIDAGHTYDDARQDYEDYGAMVIPGGIIAFHDALPRAGYEEVEVHRYLAGLSGVNYIGSEVGIAWLRKE